MTNLLEGKVAVITGGARGIGAASVRRFVEEGAKVVIADILDEPGSALASELGDAALYRHTDVSKAGDVSGLVDFAVEKFGGLHVYFSNAGVLGNQTVDFLDDDLETFQATISVDLLGPLLGAKYAGLHMRDHGGGCILTTASSTALYGGFGVLPYRAAKAGVVGMTKSLAIELGKFGIRVNCISPGPTRTPIFTDMEGIPDNKIDKLEQAAVDAMMFRVPLGRMGNPEDIANAAIFLASDMGIQVTGIDLPVDGGESAGSVDNTRDKIQTAFARILSEADA